MEQKEGYQIPDQVIDENGKVNMAAYAKTLILWGEKQNELDAIAAVISLATLQLGKTQTVGNVRATHNSGRKTYDYETPARESGQLDAGIIGAHSELKIDWQSICKDLEISEIPYTQAPPSVTIKLIN